MYTAWKMPYYKAQQSFQKISHWPNLSPPDLSHILCLGLSYNHGIVQVGELYPNFAFCSSVLVEPRRKCLRVLIPSLTFCVEKPSWIYWENQEDLDKGKRLVIHSLYLASLILPVVITPLHSSSCCNLSFKGKSINKPSINLSVDKAHSSGLFHCPLLTDKGFFSLNWLFFHLSVSNLILAQVNVCCDSDNTGLYRSLQ